MRPQRLHAATVHHGVGLCFGGDHLLQFGVRTLLLDQLLLLSETPLTHFNDALRRLGVQLGFDDGADLHARALLAVGGGGAWREKKGVLGGGFGLEELGVRERAGIARRSRPSAASSSG